MPLIHVLMCSVPLLISLKRLTWTVTTTARDAQSDMIAVRGINPRILEKGTLPGRVRLRSQYVLMCTMSIKVVL